MPPPPLFFLQPFLIKQGQRVEFVKGKAGAEAPALAFAWGKCVPKPVRRLLGLVFASQESPGQKEGFYPPAAASEREQRPVAAEDRKFVTSF